QQTLWRESPTKIEDIDALLGDIRLARRGVADRTTAHWRSELRKVLQRMGTRHRHMADQNVAYFFSLVDLKDRERRARYRDYLADQTMFRQWQKEDVATLQDLLASVVKGDRRLQGYHELGNRLGKAIDGVKRIAGPLSKKQRAYVLAGMKKLPL